MARQTKRLGVAIIRPVLRLGNQRFLYKIFLYNSISEDFINTTWAAPLETLRVPSAFRKFLSEYFGQLPLLFLQ